MLQDPNRPRFTMNELRTVLMERNELKAKLMEVEEELVTFKPKYEYRLLLMLYSFNMFIKV